MENHPAPSLPPPMQASSPPPHPPPRGPRGRHLHLCALRVGARARGCGAGGPRAAARSICPARAGVPPAPDLQSVTLSAERRPRKSAPPAPPIESVNAKWSKLTRRQSPRLRVGEAPYSLHSPAQCSLQAPIQAGLHAKEPAIRSS